ncbi:hypothetical protein NP493_1477g00028 [Ridgeia piscesae]|uniref:Uncharacterized protein n=1 Tax=Ridgeia piscesae TaxID=27915 RepID=A0AAD9K2M1_RIDPI|nr:hypothetical protein NP493_1477g00028 [Ridgeia piscesae]
MPALRHLILNNNNIETIPDNAFDGLHHLEQLLLSGNRLKTISAAWVSQKPSLNILLLGDNPLVCDCNLSWIWLNVQTDHVLTEELAQTAASLIPANASLATTVGTAKTVSVLITEINWDE